MSARAFQELFTGRTDAYGLGRGAVVRAELTLHHYASHLRGEDSGIGVFPLRDDGTVRFAAIDLDEPNFELARMMQSLIPGASWLERSRSGNAHVWVFFESDCPAWAVRTVLRSATESLNRPDVEIFPKQDRVREGGGVGNYINLPLHGDDRPILTTFEGRPSGPGELIVVPCDAWLSAALAERQDPAVWEARARLLGGKPPEERERQSEFGTAGSVHRCGAYIYEHRHDNPIQPGGRHNVLFHVAHQFFNCRAYDSDEVRDIVNEINDAAVKPLPHHEVERLLANAENGQYTYTGCDDPVMASYVDPECPIACSLPAFPGGPSAPLPDDALDV